MSLNFRYQAYNLLLLPHIITPQYIILISNEIKQAGTEFWGELWVENLTDSKILLDRG